MTGRTAECRHDPDAPFRGMRAVVVEPDTVTFRCEACGVEHVALRCAGSRTDGLRCSGAVMRRETRACPRHRKQVALADAAGGRL